jgi:hypothetical protein
VHTALFSGLGEDWREWDHLKILNVDGSIKYEKRILEKQNGRAWTGLAFLRVETSGRFL